ncbi:succinate dehydrogenase, cytochrome b556 subunit [Methylomagnum ishizawai]|uniref:succinate dehydrogenase, cytochrome b556 subunit n=1 Tax=Methylomagnum ishizawai TaxID=1760988 RepID=UPI001C330828|nr:succinate dehydrogenase, cytochrome b556 subunit [Methylomagnum ishizawai]BBL75319.1 succinate dehydrogenase cytochrome b556 subunit [Methylomagnum ishizawai]
MSERPLSPHLQVYRLPLTALLSISHRITGVVLSLGLVLWVVFLMAVAQGGSHYALAQALLDSFLGRLLLWGWIYALFFHLCHGVRHLVWDTVHGLERDTLQFYGYVELAASALLTLGAMLAAWIGG